MAEMTTIEEAGPVQRVFNWIASRAGKPIPIFGTVGAIGAAYAVSVAGDVINLAISIASLILSLMILGKQEQNECRDKLRDEALHAKIDELIAKSEARDEFIGLEERSEEEILGLKSRGTRFPGR